MRPIVVASPTLEAIQTRIKKEVDKLDDDMSRFFDPSKGFHKAKSVRRF